METMRRAALRSLRRGGALVATLCAVLALAAAPATADAAAPSLNWQPCDGDFFCATASVPLDYAHPDGATVQLAVIKHPATDPAHRIGSLLFNPGGPGGSGVSKLSLLYGLFPATLRARFDVVSFDPRGIGQSDVLRCYDTVSEQQQAFAGVPMGYPIGAARQQVWEKAFAGFDSACAAHAGPLLAHDSTADTARDMDLLRQAVGDRQLNYLGVSYGTYIGATYANLFPGKVGAITLDGDIDPVRWAAAGGDGGLGAFLRNDSDQGSAATLNAFLDQCGKASTCSFSAGTPAATRARFGTLLDRLTANPVPFDGVTFTQDVAVGVTVDLLYEMPAIPNISVGWAGLADVLRDLWLESSGTSVPNAMAAKDLTLPSLGLTPSDDVPYSGRESEMGVLCSDEPNPRVPAEYAAQAALASARSGVVGRFWAWSTEACAHWPVLSRQRYTGPWNRPTAHPILVVGNTFDPATPYRNAVAMTHDLADARLLTLHGYGHSALGNPSACVDAAESAYFTGGTLPAPGTVCQQDQQPFSG